jgi:hypothetical protein
VNVLDAIALVFPDHHALVATTVRREAEDDPKALRQGVPVVGAANGLERCFQLQEINEARDPRYVLGGRAERAPSLQVLRR